MDEEIKGTAEQAEVQTTEAPKTFTQEEVDKLLAERQSRAEKKGFEAGKAKGFENGQKEAERLAKLSEEEKAEELRKQALAEFEAEKAELAREKASLALSKSCVEKGLPVELVEHLNLDDVDAANATMDYIASLIDDAKTQAVADLKKGGAPLTKAPETESKSLLDERLKKYR